MKRIWPWLMLGLVLIAAIAGYFWWRQQQAQTAEANVLRTAQILRGDLDITVAASGNVVARQKSDLSFRLPGIVAAVNVEVGDRVAANTVLAELTPEDQERSVAQAELRLQQAQLQLERLIAPPTEENIRHAEFAISEAASALRAAQLQYTTVLSSSILNEDLAAAESRYLDAQTQYGMRVLEREEGRASDWTVDRAREAADNTYWAWTRLKQQGELNRTTTRNEVNRAYDAYQKAQDALAQLQAGPDEKDIAAVELDIETAQLTLTYARADLAKTVLHAPFAGVVAQVNVQAGVQAVAGVPAVKLIDDAVFYVEVTVDETDIGKVAVGQTVQVILDAYPSETLEGVIATIAPAASNVAGVIAYPVRIRLSPNDAVAVRDGMTASVTIRTSQLREALLAPNWAVRTDQASGETFTYCYCLENGAPVRRNIVIGARNETYTQILEGLEEGATVALVIEERSSLLDMSGPPSRPQNRP